MSSPSAPIEHLFLFPNHKGWHPISCGPVEDWPKHWNDTALPRLRELSGSPFIGKPPLCREPDGRAAMLEVYFEVVLPEDGPDTPDPFHAAYPRVRVTRSDRDRILIQMGFHPKIRPGVDRCLCNFLATSEWQFSHDPSLDCDSLSKRAMGALTGLGFLTDWPAADHGNPWSKR